jgi:hypothetical protein
VIRSRFGWGTWPRACSASAPLAGSERLRPGIPRLAEECQYFIDWTGGDLDPEMAPEFHAIQVDLARWKMRWPGVMDDPAEREALAAYAREQAERVLGWSGLLDE